jgi:hypothetical protein
MDLIRINIIMVDTFFELRRYRSCNTSALDVLTNCIEAVIYRFIRCYCLSPGSYDDTPTCGISLWLT